MNKSYYITSDPSGAVVTSGDVVYGTTPFHSDLNTILPNRQWDFKVSASRRLTFTKVGYLPGSAVVTEFGAGGTIHVDLQRSTAREDALGELKALFDKGLISQEDYDRERKEVLDAP